MATTEDEWGIVHDLIFGSPHPLLVGIESAVALLMLIALTAFVVRFWRGDRIELGALKIERPDILRELRASLVALSKDDRLKANVLWAFRENLTSATSIVSRGMDASRVHRWSTVILTDVITALSEGGDNRHRASIWVPAGDRLRLYTGVGFREEALAKATLPLDSIAGNVMRTGRLHNSTNIAADNAFFPKPRSGRAYRSLLAVPIKAPNGKAVAALCIDAETQGYFDTDHEFFANCFADLLALLLAQIPIGE